MKRILLSLLVLGLLVGSVLPFVQPVYATFPPAMYAGLGVEVSESPYDDEDWTGQANIYADDATYAYITSSGFDTADYSWVLKATTFNHVVPVGAAILGIKVEIEKYGANGHARDYVVQLTKNGTVRVGNNKADTGNDWAAAPAISTYGTGTTDLWGTTWTAAEINASTFGVHLVAKATQDDADVFVDYIRITVYYNAEVFYPAGPGTYTNIDHATGTHWEQVDEVSADGDTSYVEQQGGTYDYRLDTYALPDTMPDSSVIYGVTVYWIGRREQVLGTAATVQGKSAIYSGGIISYGTGHSLANAYTFYGDTWTTNPADDQLWEQGDIDDLEIGVSLQAYNTASYKTYGRCTQIFTTVAYAPLSAPVVSTSDASDVSCDIATLNGEITGTGGDTPDYYGFVWDTSSHGDPGDVAPGASGYSDNWTSALGSYGVDDYSHNIDSLNVDDTYYVRFAAHNSEGWSYGDEVDFDTLAIPTIITQSATDKTVSSARLHAYLDSDGGQACQVRFGWGESDESDNITAYDHYSVYAGSYTTGQSPYLDIDALDAGTTYYFNVEAYGAGCATDTGVSDNFTTESDVGTPSNVIAIPDIDNVTLSWVKGTGAPNTFIRFKMNACPADETDGTLIYMSTASTYTHEDLVSGADYCYYLVGYDSVEGYSSGHVTIHATTLAAGLPADTEGEAIDKPAGGMTSSPAVSATLIDKIPILVFTQKDAAAIGMPHANFLYIIMLLGMMGLSYAVYRWTYEPMVIVAVWLIGVAWIARPILGVPLVVPIFITIVGAGYSVYRMRSVV